MQEKNKTEKAFSLIGCTSLTVLKKKLSEECIMAGTYVYIVDDCVVLAVATNTLTHQRDKLMV